MNEKGIELKNELVAKAKELAEKAENITFNEVNELKRKWRRASSEEESFAEKELNDKFDEIMAEISSKATDLSQSVEEKKNEIIKEAKEISTKNYKEATAKMDELMERWKAAGRCGEKDDELWAEFKAARDEFFTNKKAYFENLKENFKKVKEEKENIIQEAIDANKLDNFKQIGTKMDELMDKWKAAGYAGKENEDDLWKQFSEQRKLFFEKRKEYYESMKETYAARVEEKKALIQEAKQNLARSEFSEEEISLVKGLRDKWKAIGFAGKDNEDSLWEEFNNTVNKYYENMRFYKNNK